MVKKFLNNLKIDFEKCLIENRLLQVRNSAARNDLNLIETWSIDICPRSSPKVLGLIRDLSLEDTISLTHIKRIQKVDNSKLTVIVCSKLRYTEEEIRHQLKYNEINFAELKVRNVPGKCPSTKDLALEWGRNYWPILWKGNPNDQILNEVDMDMVQVRKYLDLITSQKYESSLHISTAIVDPRTDSLISLCHDSRHIHPLHHSIMCCIQGVADYEQRKRKTTEEQHYLCYGYHVYTTHEPCSMCAMALIHSRISRLIYLRQSPSTGALNPKSGEGYVIQDHKVLNSSFEVWEWVGDEYHAQSINPEINV